MKRPKNWCQAMSAAEVDFAVMIRFLTFANHHLANVRKSLMTWPVFVTSLADQLSVPTIARHDSY